VASDFNGGEFGVGDTIAATGASSASAAGGATDDTLAATATATAQAPPDTRTGATTRADGQGPTTVLPAVEDQDGRMVLVPRTEERYRRERVLGEGGMGIVELARDADIGRSVAVKRLRAPRTSPTAVARFIDEVRTIGRLDHPGIAPIHDVGIDAEGAFFFVMKYIDGETLEDIIERLRSGDTKAHAEYTFDRRTAIVLSILNTVEYAHSKGLLHRDLKPANVLVGPYGEVLLVDWGIARPIGGDADRIAPEDEEGDDGGDGRSRLVSTHEGAVIGTPLYMSPEQARGETNGLDARSDVYSAGVLFLELLALRHPLDDHKSVPAICSALQTVEPPGITQSFWEHPGQDPVPAELRHFVRRALANDREERWQSVGEMLAELERVRAGDFRAQCPATFMKRAQHRTLPFIDKHPLLAILGSLLMVTMLSGSAASLLYLLLGA